MRTQKKRRRRRAGKRPGTSDVTWSFAMTCVAPGPLGDPGPRREPNLLGWIPLAFRNTCTAADPLAAMAERPRFGAGRDLVLQISDDFDEPLEEFADLAPEAGAPMTFIPPLDGVYFLPRQVVIEAIPFCDTFGRSEHECAVAYLVLALQHAGRGWSPVTLGEIEAAVLALGQGRGHFSKNPFLVPDLDGLVQAGFAERGPETFSLTDIALYRLVRWVRHH